MATKMAATAQRKPLIPPSMAWLTVFIPALTYFIVTRLHFDSSLSFRVVTDRIENDDMTSVFYSSNDGKLTYPLYMLVESSLENVVASVWRHDAELGRGYLLLSQTHGAGRIWRWERGGGPIPIGKTLAMDPSGCRSKDYCNEVEKQHGSGGLAVDFYKSESFRQGHLVVAEWGEGRIVRLEEETGARTPLVLRALEGKRVDRPISMLFTPFGDLLFLEFSRTTIQRMRQAVHVPPLASSMESRLAHKWNSTNHDFLVETAYQNAYIGSMALDETGMGLYVTVKQDDSVLLVHLSLLEDDDDEDDADKEEQQDADNEMGVFGKSARVVFNLSSASIESPPIGMAVDAKGHIFLATSAGVQVCSEGKVLGTLKTPPNITSLTLGEDGYLYVTTSTELLRIRVRHGPPKIPTDRVKKLKHK